MFVSGASNPFSPATFHHYWTRLLDRRAKEFGVTCFPPSLARTSFVSEYTNSLGVHPNMWDGAATVMGNTVRTWHRNYSPHKRSRECQRSVDLHNAFVMTVLGANDG